MTLPSNLNALVEQVNNELDQIDRELSQTLELIRVRINLFPENIVLIQLFATLNNYVLFTQNTKRQVKEICQHITTSERLSDRDIQEAGEDLSEQLGRILEAKIVVNNIKIRLQN